MFTGRERDGIFITEDCIHLVECTTSREKAKAQKDLLKLFELYKEHRKNNQERAIKCWFVTKHEPTAEQRACRKEIKGVSDGLFNIISFAQFQAKLVDSHEYLQARGAHKFGSIYDPRTQSTTAEVKYIEVGLIFEGELEPASVSVVAERLLSGERFTFLGEYGIGKSMSLRETFRCLSVNHRRGSTPMFPVYLNLREHQGQHEPAEILERHARNIGYRNPSQIVRAWKAGYLVLLIDGFDEVSSLGLQGAWRRLKDARHASMTGVRKLVTETPEKCGIILAGRENFFDTASERKQALGEGSSWKTVRFGEFSESQIRELAGQFGYTGEIPSWIPSRPLLIATLFARGLNVADSEKLSLLGDPASGWDLLLNEVCKREARIEHGISGENVRRILESLATIARSKDSGLGPLTPDDIVAVFQSECGFAPTDEALIVLQRLPGLGRDSEDSESRAFVDSEFADACRAGDFFRFCQDPFNSESTNRLRDARFVLGPIGVAVASNRLGIDGFVEGNLTAAVKATAKHDKEGATPADLVNVALKLGLAIRDRVDVSKLVVDVLEIEGDRADLINVVFRDCYFNRLEIAHEVTASGCPLFEECLIQELDGRVSENDLPEGRFPKCAIEAFSSTTGTTSGLLDLKIPLGTKVMITILKKLFVQSLSGRQENALYRGLDASHQSKVLPVLTLLKSHSIISTSERPGEPIWLPVRRQRSRVLSILNSPSKSSDPIVVEAGRL